MLRHPHEFGHPDVRPDISMAHQVTSFTREVAGLPDITGKGVAALLGSTAVLDLSNPQLWVDTSRPEIKARTVTFEDASSINMFVGHDPQPLPEAGAPAPDASSKDLEFLVHLLVADPAHRAGTFDARYKVIRYDTSVYVQTWRQATSLELQTIANLIDNLGIDNEELTIPVLELMRMIDREATLLAKGLPAESDPELASLRQRDPMYAFLADYTRQQLRGGNLAQPRPRAISLKHAQSLGALLVNL